MKRGLAAVAVAALAGDACAAVHGHGHGNLFAKRDNMTGQVCLPECTTIWSVVTGEATLVPAVVPGTKTMTAISTDVTTVTIVTPIPQKPAPQQPAPQQPAPQQPAPQQPAPQQPAPPQQPALTGAPVPPGVHTFAATTVIIAEATTVCAAQSNMATAGTHVVGGVSVVVDTANAKCPVAKVYNPGTYVAPEQVVTVTKTGYVYYCPLTRSGLPATTPAPAPRPTKAVLPPPPPPPAPAYEAPAPPTTEEAPLSTAKVPVVSKHRKIAVPTYEVPAAPTLSSHVPVPTHNEVPVAPTHEKVPVVVVSTLKVPVAPTRKEPSPPAHTQLSPGPKHGNPKLVSDNDHFGITYTPYAPKTGECKSSEQVDKDISEIKKAGFTTVRVYSTDCHTLEHVGDACHKHKVQMIVGIFVKDKGCSYDSPAIKEQVDKLSQWDKWALVSLVVVGNEAIMNGHCTPRQLRDLVTTVKSKCTAYKGKYTISETLNIWQRPDVKSEICGVVDVTGANIHPYFNAGIAPQKAGEFVASQLRDLAQVCGHNDVINLECGWPTRGNANGEAKPGKEQQQAAIKSIREATGHNTVFFSYEDDMWKEAGACGCEQSWGTAASFNVEASY